MSTIHFHETTTATIEQFVAALTDFGPDRSTLFGNSADEYLEVHEQGRDHADVTEGSGGVWERLSYDWSDPNHIVLKSVSAFYRNFQAVTAMSPIQFQKQIRLQEARLLLATHPGDVTGVGRRVGYDNPSQFSREYRRQFGAPPSRDAARLRDTGPTPAGVLT
ncbi:helix-turn-helix transcriptional regulator [Rhodococcus sp. NPDC003348]